MAAYAVVFSGIKLNLWSCAGSLFWGSVAVLAFGIKIPVAQAF
jgi:hypothetical protein